MKRAPEPEKDDLVQVVMTEEMARAFERRCLCGNTKGYTSLSPLLLVADDDLPTYFIVVDGCGP